MDEESDHTCLCCLRGIMPTISKKWAICIISSIGRHQTMRFSEIMNNCGSISPKSLADVLKDLQKAGLIRRISYAEIPPRVEYVLTDDGKTLREAISPLLKWAKSWNQNHRYRITTPCLPAPDP
jgi:DNA-binding HxlR family transcriptional regulator